MASTFNGRSLVKLSWEDGKSGTLRIVRFDVVTSESYEAIMAITSHPVEKGADVTDHAREDSETLSIEGFLSFTPLYPNPGVEQNADYANIALQPFYPARLGGAPAFTPGGFTTAVATSIASLVSSPPPPPKAKVLKFTSADAAAKRVLDRIEWLQTARKEAARLHVLAGRGAHDLEDMLIERISIPRTPADSGGLVVQVALKRARIVSSEIVAAPRSAEERGQPTVNTGSKAVDPASKKQEDTAKSLAASLYDGGKGAVGGAIKSLAGL